MTRLSANTGFFMPPPPWAAINARHFAAVVFVIPPDRDEADGRSQMGLPGAYGSMRRTPLGERPTRRQDLPAWYAAAMGRQAGRLDLARGPQRTPPGGVVAPGVRCRDAIRLQARLDARPGQPSSHSPPPFASVPARPTGTVFVTALRAEQRPVCPTTCQMTVAPGPQGLGALSFLEGA
jgi:hypothetical protein